MEVTLYGVRGGIASGSKEVMEHGGNTPCVGIRSAAGHSLILDAGTGIRQLGQELVAQADSNGGMQTVSILLSHFHWDHVQGLPFFAPFWDARFLLEVYAAAPVGDIKRCVQQQFAPPFFPLALGAAAAQVRFHSLGQAQTIAGIHVTAFAQHHPGGSTGFRLEQDGKALVYATDSEDGDESCEQRLVAEAHGAHTLILDAQYTPEEKSLRRGWGHGDWQRACAVASLARVERLLLFHHDAARTDSALEGIEQQARRRFASARTAREGQNFLVV